MKKPVCLSSLFPFLFLAICASAQEITLPLYPEGKVPNFRKTDEIEKKDSTDIVRISKVQSPEIDVFLPAK